MFRDRALVASIALVIGGACSSAAGEKKPARLDPSGRYAHAAGIAASMRVERSGSGYVVLLAGGSPKDAGAAAPADCDVRAEGQLNGRTLEAAFTAVETDTFSYSAKQAGKEQRKLSVSFEGNAAEVTRADTDGYCGLGASFVGRYRRVGPLP